MSKYEWKFTIKGGPGSGHWGHAGRPGQRGGSLPSGAIPANKIVDDAPEALQKIIDRSVLLPTEFSGRLSHAAAVAPIKRGDIYVISVAHGRRTSKSTIIHEAVHGHQSEMGIEESDLWEKKFSDAAKKDNATIKKPLWSDSMLWDGGEIWAAAAGFYYGGGVKLLDDSPNVRDLLIELYGEKR